jgi:S-adenosylmethionine:diacylglycerol 3-amino-3-carboxypropyl transferase
MSAATAAAPRAAPAIAGRAAFDFIRYASVWEDADVLCDALAPVATGGRLLSIASAGDNALALLTLDPAEVLAVDLSPAQLACVALRIAAFEALDHDALLAFLGVRPADDRAATYSRLRARLTPEHAAFWDAHPALVRAGVIHGGKFERYFHLFRTWMLPLVHSRAGVDALFAPRDREGRERFYARRWDTWRWRALFRVFFSRTVMGRLGRDPEFFAQVDGPVAERIMARARYAMTVLPTADNPYLARTLTGNFREPALPRYLERRHFECIRSRLPRLRLALLPADQAEGRFDGFNLSDIFEYMDPGEHQRCYLRLLERARPGSRLVYWNMLAPRAAPAAADGRVRPLAELAAELHARDRAFFYQRLQVEEVLAGPKA